MCTSEKTVKNTVKQSAYRRVKTLDSLPILFLVQYVMRLEGGDSRYIIDHPKPLISRCIIKRISIRLSPRHSHSIVPKHHNALIYKRKIFLLTV
jgi:hypothetical protein